MVTKETQYPTIVCGETTAGGDHARLTCPDVEVAGGVKVRLTETEAEPVWFTVTVLAAALMASTYVPP